MRTLFIITLFIVTLTSCSKKTDKIEIYLVKHRIQFSEGIPIEIDNTYDEDSKEALRILKEKNVRNDTANEQFIYAGKFKATKEDLEPKPFFNDNEILSFKQNTSELQISKSAFEKLGKLGSTNSKNGIGIQFVVCINEKPTLFGYFFNYAYFVSYLPSTYNLSYTNPEKEMNTKNSYFLHFRVGENLPKSKMRDRNLNSINEKELFSAFKNSNRLE